MQNPDGSATCDRCGIWLEGYGVTHGLCCTDLDGETLRELIFCYRNQCRTFVLDGFVNQQIAAGDTACNHCGVDLQIRSISTAMLASDIAPTGSVDRRLQFCYVNGSRNQFLDRIDPTGVKF